MTWPRQKRSDRLKELGLSNVAKKLTRKWIVCQHHDHCQPYGFLATLYQNGGTLLAGRHCMDALFADPDAATLREARVGKHKKAGSRKDLELAFGRKLRCMDVPLKGKAAERKYVKRFNAELAAKGVSEKRAFALAETKQVSATSFKHLDYCYWNAPCDEALDPLMLDTVQKILAADPDANILLYDQYPHPEVETTLTWLRENAPGRFAFAHHKMRVDYLFLNDPDYQELDVRLWKTADIRILAPLVYRCQKRLPDGTLLNEDWMQRADATLPHLEHGGTFDLRMIERLLCIAEAKLRTK